MFHDAVLDKRLTWAVGLFRTVDDYGEGSDDGDYAITGRVTGLPWYMEDGRKLVHLGASYSHRPRNGALRLRARPEAHLSDFRYVDTGVLETEDMDLYGVEAAFKYGPFSLQGEYIRADIDSVRRSVFNNFVWRDQDDIAMDGYYVAASYLLTGEERPYSTSSGVFGRVKPRNNFSLTGAGWGAFELAVRFSNLDLSDGHVYGGDEDNWTIGLNWYLNPHTRMMLNYIHGDIDRSMPLGASGLLRRGYDGDIDILQTRFQVDF
jgi:phosphate-selective porin OprO/OprP